MSELPTHDDSQALTGGARHDGLRVSQLLHMVPDTIFRMRVDGKWIGCNEPDGSEPRSTPAVASACPVHSTQVAACKAAVARACSASTPELIEYAIRDDAGESYFEIRVIPISSDESLVTIRDVSQRKREEAEHRRLGQRLAMYFRQTAVGMIEWDIDQRVVEWNPGAQRIFGYSREQAIGRLASELVTPAEGLRVSSKLWKELVAGHIGVRSELEHVTGSGGRIHCEWFNTPLVDEHGRVTGVASLVQDATDRTRAQREVQRSREQYARLVNSIEGIVWEADPLTGQFTFVSDQVEWILGVPASRWIGNPKLWESKVHPDDLDRMRACTREHIDRKQDHQYEFRVQDADGSIVWLRNYVTVDSGSGEPVLLRGIMVDVTRIKEAEAALQASEARFRRVVESNLIGLFFWEPHGRILDANQAFLRMLGFAEGEVSSRALSWRELTPPEFCAADEHAIAELRREGHCKPYAKEFIRSDGARVPVLLGAAWLDSTRQQGIAFVVDIADRKRAEEWQALMMAELDHRVKNNMAAVLTLAEQTLRSMPGSAEQGGALLGRLRAFSRAHTAIATTHWQGARLLPLVQRLTEPFRNLEGSNVRIAGEDLLLPPRVATVLSMALHELGTNAMKYGSLSVPQGSVEIAWESREADGETRMLHMTWNERGGPPVVAPVRRGFGSELIEGGIRYECAGKAQLQFFPGGVQCEFVVPLVDPQNPPVIVKQGVLKTLRL